MNNSGDDGQVVWTALWGHTVAQHLEALVWRTIPVLDELHHRPEPLRLALRVTHLTGKL